MKKILLLVVIISFLSGCDRSTLAEKRAHYASRKNGDIVIGAVWSNASAADFEDGLNLAVDQINSSGGVLGRKIKLIPQDDKNSINQGLVVAHQFASNPKMNFVVSHETSFIALPALATYSSSDIVLVESSATSTQLTEKNYPYIFRITPNNQQMADYLAAYASAKKLNRAIIMYVKNEYGRNFANFFELAAEDFGIEIIERMSYQSQGKNYLHLIDDWGRLFHFDVLLLIGDLPDPAYIIKTAREEGVTQTIISDNSLFDPKLLEIAKTAANGVIVISNFNSESSNPTTRAFVEAYQKRFGKKPSERAAYGYESIKLLAYAIEKTGSIHGPTVAKFLHEMKPWTGVMGPTNFDESGNLKTINLVKYQVVNQKFELIQ